MASVFDSKEIFNPDRLIPLPGSEKQRDCIHDYRLLNRNERRRKMVKRFNAKGVCVKCGCLFVAPELELTTGEKPNA